MTGGRRARRAGGGQRASRARDREIGGSQVEGPRAVLELLTARRRAVRSIWIEQRHDRRGALTEVEAAADRAGLRPKRVDTQVLASRARTGAPQGVIATAEPVLSVPLAELTRVSLPFVVALDGVTDPVNLGAVLRTADAAGATGVVVPRRRSAHLTPAATKAAAGAVEHVPVAVVSGIPNALERLRRAGCWVVGLDERGDVILAEAGLGVEPVALVLGAEGRGLARLTRERCDLLARIPMHGALSSLNVGAAAAVACFEVARHRADDSAEDELRS